MTTRITSTDDVGRISVATNDVASITWYVYERPFGTGTTLFVQRDSTALGFESEVRLLTEGERPEIFFDTEERIWIITYVLNEKLYMITADENDPPATLVAQTGTIIDHMRMGTLDGKQGQDQVVRQISSELVTGIAAIDADNTRSPDAVSVGKGDGGNWVVRWRAEPSSSSNLNINIAGFNVYIRRFSDGATVRLNTEIIPFVGLDPEVYEFEFSPTKGRFYVTQINFKGDASSQLVEGRIKPPFDQITADIIGNESEVGRLMGDPDDQLSFTIVETAPITSITADTAQQSGLGEGLFLTQSIPFEFDIVQVVSASLQPPIKDSYAQSGLGEGIFLFISGAGLDSIIVG